MILRRAALIAAGLAMSTGVGLAGASAASGAAPRAGLSGTYTIEVAGGGGCEVISASNGSFTGDKLSDAGISAGGGNAIVGGASVALYWTAGGDTGLLFSGAKVSSTTWKGNFGGTGAGLKGKLVKGAVSGC